MRNSRIFFLLALWSARLTEFAIKLSGKNVPYYPGYIAMKICPEFLTFFDFKNPIIAVTGTNGKSTVSSMLVSCFKKNGYKKVINNKGFNTIVGLCSYIIKSTSFFGRLDYDVAVLEVDEKSSPKIYKYIKPDYVVCTNIFRDSIKNNAHSDYILDIMQQGIPKESVLLLNADDALCARLGEGRSAVYYGIERVSSDHFLSRNIVCDVVYCPRCGEKIIYEDIRYNHIGKFRCPQCGYTNPVCDYSVVHINEESKTMTVRSKDGDEAYALISDNVFNTYNMLSCIALLKTFGFGNQAVAAMLTDMQIDNTRFTQVVQNGVRIITHMAKGMNPVACSRVFEYAAQARGQKAVILVVDDVMDNRVSSEMICWIYDTDFEFLNSDTISQVVIGGKRCEDLKLRMLIGGVDASKIVTVEHEKDTVQALHLDGIDTVMVLYEVFAYELSAALKNAIIEKIRANKQ